MFVRLAASVLALGLMTAGASALTVTNKTSEAHTIGVDYGNTEKVEKIAAGKSVKIDGCEESCGITGPWQYSWMAKTGDTLVFDENGLKPSNM